MSETQKLLAFIEKRGYTHLIFDLDETVSWLKLPWEEGYEMLCQRASHNLELLMREKWQEKDDYSYIVNPAVRVSESFLPIAIDWAVQFESQLIEHAPNLELVSKIAPLAEKHTVYLWSSNTRSAIKRVLEDLDIAHYFTRIIGREDVKYLKPSVDGWKHIVADDIPLERYLFIGDSYNDKFAAEQIGIDFFEVAHFRRTKITDIRKLKQ